MKNFNLVPLCLVISALFLSCTKDDNLQLSHNRQLDATVENGVVRNIRDFIHYSKFDGIATKAESQYTLDPYVYKGDTIMYVANYAGGGWELLSADYRAPIVLVSSESGYFDNSQELAPSVDAYMSLLKEDLVSIRNVSFSNGDIDSSWRAVKLFQEDVNPARIKVAPKAMGSTPGGDGEWVLLERSEPVSHIESVPKLTLTNWQQEQPWNNFVPYLNDRTEHAYAGCGPVAVGQFLYFMHNKTGIPQSTITSASYDTRRNTYSYSGNSSTVWDLMAKNSYENGTDYAAMFIGYVGKSCDAKYGKKIKNNQKEPTGVDRSKVLRFINSLGFNYVLAEIDYTYVYDQLEQGFPVLARADCTDAGHGGHMFIIDGSETENSRYTNTYGWVGTDNYGNDSNEYDEDGNIIGYAFTYDQEVTNSTVKLMMNWGYGSYYGNIKYTIGNWNAGGHSFNANRMIFKNNN